jgi:tetratricopeptide (TPR) repeat protein
MTASAPSPAQLDALWNRLHAGEPGAVLDALAAHDATRPPALTLRALARLGVADWSGALADLEAVLAAQPENAVAALHRVFPLHHLGRHAEAAALLRGGAVLMPHRDFLAQFVETFWPLHFTTALGAPRAEVPAALLAPPQDPAPGIEPTGNPILALSRVLIALGSAGGRAALARQREANRRAAGGIRAYMAGDLGAALDHLARAHRAEPANEGTAANLAFALLAANQPAAALDVVLPHLAEAALPDTIVSAGRALHHLGRQEEALRLLAVVEAEGPEDYYAHFARATCLLAQGNPAWRPMLDTALDGYFIDTWEQMLVPFIRRVADWMADGAR